MRAPAGASFVPFTRVSSLRKPAPASSRHPYSRNTARLGQEGTLIMPFELGELGPISGFKELAVLYDSQDIRAVLEHVRLSRLFDYGYMPQGITAVAVIVGDGDYAAIFVTDSSRPYSAQAIFCRVE